MISVQSGRSATHCGDVLAGQTFVQEVAEAVLHQRRCEREEDDGPEGSEEVGHCGGRVRRRRDVGRDKQFDKTNRL